MGPWARHLGSASVLLLLAANGGGCAPPAKLPETKFIARESFDYPAGGKLVGQTGGQGFEKSWVVGGFGVSDANDLIIGEGSLTYPGIVSSGNRLVCRTDNQQGLMREFGPFFKTTKGVRYLSFLLRPEGPPTSPAGPLYYGIVLSYGPDFELSFGKPGGGFVDQYVSERRGGSMQQSTGVAAKIGETALIVIRADFSNSEIGDYKLYVNPGATEPTKGIVIGMHDARIPRLIIYTQGKFSLDEIRVTERYEDAVPQPKAKSFSFF